VITVNSGKSCHPKCTGLFHIIFSDSEAMELINKYCEKVPILIFCLILRGSDEMLSAIISGEFTFR